MIDLDAARERCRSLAARLEGQPHWPELRAVYLDLSTLVGQLQGAVSEARRARPASEEARAAEAAFDRLRAGARRVGLDIRLASEPALQLGLQEALKSASETLDRLQHLET